MSEITRIASWQNSVGKLQVPSAEIYDLPALSEGVSQ